MTELLEKYKKYVEHLITISCGSMSNYKFDEARAEDIQGQPLHGYNCAIWEESTNENWTRIPSPDFDKDSVVYYYCGNLYARWRMMNVISSVCPDKLLIISYTSKD